MKTRLKRAVVSENRKKNLPRKWVSTIGPWLVLILDLQSLDYIGNAEIGKTVML